MFQPSGPGSPSWSIRYSNLLEIFLKVLGFQSFEEYFMKRTFLLFWFNQLNVSLVFWFVLKWCSRKVKLPRLSFLRMILKWWDYWKRRLFNNPYLVWITDSPQNIRIKQNMYINCDLQFTFEIPWLLIIIMI